MTDLIKEVQPDEIEQATQISLHSIRNLLGSEQQLDLFTQEKIQEIARAHGVTVGREITQFGIDLTDVQLRVMEGILHGFTKTKYKGNLEPIDQPSHTKEKYPLGSPSSAYYYLEQLPRLRVSQAQILEWAGVNRGSPGDIQEALKALKHLGTTQYCFYYTRLVFDELGNPKKDKDGDWQKEEITAVDTLITIKEVQDQKDRLRRYYEIILSPIFLDQRENYFMMIPFNWREEVRKLIGQKKASSYTFRFLLFLRYRFELCRRSSRKRQDCSIIKIRPRTLCIQLRMPQSVYKQKTRANKVLDDAYFVAKSLGYLKSYERTEQHDILILNEEKYHQPKYEERLLPIADKTDSAERKRARELWDILVQEKRKLNPRYNPVASGHIMDISLSHLEHLVKNKGFDDVKRVVLWGASKSYWCTRIGTPSALRKHFDEAFFEMLAMEAKEKGKVVPEQQNRAFVIKIAAHLKELGMSSVKVEPLNKHVEISMRAGEIYPSSIAYSDHGFRNQVENALRKRKISLDDLDMSSL